MPPATRYAITHPVTLAHGQVVHFTVNHPDTCTFDTHEDALTALNMVRDSLLCIGEVPTDMKVTPYNLMLNGTDGQHLPMLLPANHIRFQMVG